MKAQNILTDGIESEADKRVLNYRDFYDHQESDAEGSEGEKAEE